MTSLPIKCDIKMAGSGPKLKALPSSTVRLITSSQVITSTHSVVKELVENALDAAATCIDIKLENYGFGKIEVRDNGCGIEHSDTPYMARPHYTSKITCLDDLGDLETYGFRGEALGSLCGVSDVSITTRTTDSDISTVYELDSHGVVANMKPSHLGQGTTVVAANLFKNLPVRRQFYNTARKQKEELKRVEDLVVTYGIIYPRVRFELRHNKCVTWQKGAVTDHREALLGVWGAGVLGHMTHVKRQPQGFDIECFLLKRSTPSAGHLARTANDRCFFFVNKRPVIMKEVEKLLRRYYSNATGCDNSRVPMSFISVTVTPSSVDVNVDPNKTKVMLHEKNSFLQFMGDLFAEVYGALKAGADNNRRMQPLPQDTDLCRSTNASSHKTQKISECRDEGSCSNGQKPAGGEIHTAAQSGESENRVQGYSRYETLLQIEEVNNNSNMHAFSGAPSTPVHNEDARLLHLHPEHLDQEAQSSCVNSLHHEASDSRSVSDACHPSAEDSPNSVPSVDFNLLDDDLDIAVMEHLAAETRQTTMLPPGGVKISNESCEDGDLFERKGGGCLKGTSSTRDGGHSEAPLRDVGGVNGAEKWSRGETVVERDGETVQPVTLLMPSHGKNGTENEERRNLPSTDVRQMTLHDIVEGRTIKRPSTSYIFFCKEMRSKVAAENSGANFQEISKLVSEKWNSLSAEERKQYETLAAADTERYKDQMSSQNQPTMSTPSPAQTGKKKRKLGQACGQRALPTMFSRLSPISRQVKQEFAKFSMKALRQMYSKPFQSSQIWRQQTGKLLLIGQLKSHGVWLGIHDNRIMLFHPTRAKEELIFHRLMQHHMIPVNQLEQPITLYAVDVGGQECWDVLQSLEKSAVGINDSYIHYTDARLVNNGLKLRESYIDGNISNPKIVIVAMTTCMNYFGTSDLREILQLITQNPSVTVSDSRPSKVRHYIQGEAVRMSRQLPMGLSREEVEALLEETAQLLPHGTTTCFHHRPFLSCLFHLDHMVQSEDLEAMSASFELTT